MVSKTSTVTVLYYDQNDMTAICSDVLNDLEVQTDDRVIFPNSYRDDKIIIAVLDGNCQVRNSLGDRAIFY